MLRRLERVLDLRPGELGRGLLLFAYLFFVIGSFTVGKAVRDALFLDEFGAMLLPYADMAIAAIVGIWVSIYLLIARRANVRTLLMGSLGFFALNCLAFWYLTHISDAPWLIMFTFAGSTARKRRAAMPGLNFRLSPTTQTIALPCSTSTSPKLPRSRLMASSL